MHIAASSIVANTLTLPYTRPLTLSINMSSDRKDKEITGVDPVRDPLPALKTAAVNQIFVIKGSETKDFLIGTKDCLYLTHSDGTVVNLFIKNSKLHAAAGNPYPNEIEIILEDTVANFEAGKLRIEIIEEKGSTEDDKQFSVRVNDLSGQEVIIASIGNIIRAINRELGEVVASEVDLDKGGSCDIEWGGAEEITICLRKEKYVICKIREDDSEIYFENPNSGQRHTLKIGENLIGRNYQGSKFFGDSGDRVSKNHLSIRLTVTDGRKILHFQDLDSTNGSKLKISRRPYIRRNVGKGESTVVDLASDHNFEVVSICSGSQGSIMSSDARMLAITHPGNPSSSNNSGILCDPKIRTIALVERSRPDANARLAGKLALQSMYIDAVARNQLSDMGSHACDYLRTHLPPGYSYSRSPGVMAAFAREVSHPDGRYVEGFTVGDCHAYILGLHDGLIYHPSRWENQALTPFGMQGDLHKFKTSVKNGEKVLILLLSYLVSSMVPPVELKKILGTAIRNRNVENLAHVVAKLAGLEQGREQLSSKEADFAVAQMICGGES